MKIENHNIYEYIDILKNKNLITDFFYEKINSIDSINSKITLLLEYIHNLNIAKDNDKEIVSELIEKLYEYLFTEEQDNWPRKGINLGLERMKNLLKLLDNPENILNVIHIGGTNGKGSTCSFIQSILMESGYKVGLYTSPSIIAENEGIRINKDFIPFERAYKMLMDIKELWINKYGTDDFPSYFEVFTALSILYFKEENVDFAIYEVGLGGRFDATNVFNKKLLSIITSISSDHLGIIGNNIEEITYEKAGIIQENDNIILYPLEDKLINIIESIGKEKNANLEILKKKDIFVEEIGVYNNKFSFKNHKDIVINMVGEHQIYNSSLAIMAIDNLNKRNIIKISEDILIKGLLKANWPGRLEWLSLSPRVLIDGAHNEDSIVNLVKYLKDIDYSNLKILIGVLKDKDYNKIFKSLSTLNPEFYLTEVPFEDRKMTVEDMNNCLYFYSHNIHMEKNPIKALNKLIDSIKEDDLVVITGSLYLISVLRNYILENNIFK